MSLISFWPKHTIEKIIPRASCLDAPKGSSSAGYKTHGMSRTLASR